MPFALIAIGLILTIAGARGTQGTLFNLLKGDFTGNQSYLWWALSIVAVGAVGYVKSLRPLSHGFLVLILIVFVVAQYKGGKDLFKSFIDQVRAGTTNVPATTAANDNAGEGGTGGSVFNSGSALLSSLNR